jgi:hypothetical protein
VATQQLLIRLPEDLAPRLKRRVPARASSAFVQRLLEQALPADEVEDDPPPIVVATPSAGAHSVAVCDQVRAVDKGRLSRFSGQLAAGDLQAIEAGVRTVLDL